VRASAVDWLMMNANEPLLPKKDIILDIFLNGVKRHEI
jgi:hypothetical protein